MVDDVSMLAIEACLIDHLPSIFTTETVWEINDQTVSSVTAEEEKSSPERARYIQKKTVLEKGLRELKRIQDHSSIHANGTGVG